MTLLSKDKIRFLLGDAKLVQTRMTNLAMIIESPRKDLTTIIQCQSMVGPAFYGSYSISGQTVDEAKPPLSQAFVTKLKWTKCNKK